MSTLDQTVDQQVTAQATAAPSPILDALTSSDHKVIGRLLIGSSLAATVLVAAVGAVLGFERIDGDGTVVATRVLPELFAGFRFGLVLIALAPLLLGLSVVVVPLQLGARSLAFPRLAAAGFWAWLGGVALVVVSLFNNGGPGGTNVDMVRLYLGGAALMVAGLVAVAATVATSVLTTRAPGMKLHRVPLFSWSALVGALAVVLALPVAFGVLVYLYIDNRYAAAETSLFGGSAAIDGWAAWILTGPALALFVAPAVGIFAELVPVIFKARVPQRGAALAGLALVGTGVLGGVTQLRAVGLAGTGSAVEAGNFLTKVGLLGDWAIFNLLPALGVVVVFGLVALLAKPKPGAAKPKPGAAKPKPIAPFVYALFGTLFVLGGFVANAVNGIEDLALAGTVFEEGAAVAIVYGSILAALGGVAYWAPKWTGTMLAAGPLYGIALLGAGGALLASAPYLIAGFADQPAFAVVYGNDGPGELWNGAVFVGHALFALATLAFVGLLFKPRGDAEPAGDDPWDGQTLEWATTSPAPLDNFAAVALVRSPEPLLDLKQGAASADGTHAETSEEASA